jgi:hypothetical protein
MSNTMQTSTLKLPDKFISILTNLPETGMGYQLVKIILKDGKTLHQRKVLNSEFLMLEEQENIMANEIDHIEPEQVK